MQILMCWKVLQQVKHKAKIGNYKRKCIFIGFKNHKLYLGRMLTVVLALDKLFKIAIIPNVGPLRYKNLP